MQKKTFRTELANCLLLSFSFHNINLKIGPCHLIAQVMVNLSKKDHFLSSSSSFKAGEYSRSGVTFLPAETLYCPMGAGGLLVNSWGHWKEAGSCAHSTPGIR
jgi:hypothetical protein